MPDGPNPGQSYEAWIESMAGASPPETGEDGLTYVDGVAEQGLPEYEAWLRRHLRERGDFPMPVPPPYEADDEGKAEPDE